MTSQGWNVTPDLPDLARRLSGLLVGSRQCSERCRGMDTRPPPLLSLSSSWSLAWLPPSPSSSWRSHCSTITNISSLRCISSGTVFVQIHSQTHPPPNQSTRKSNYAVWERTHGTSSCFRSSFGSSPGQQQGPNFIRETRAKWVLGAENQLVSCSVNKHCWAHTPLCTGPGLRAGAVEVIMFHSLPSESTVY